MADFIVYALITGLLIALISGPLGAFIVWRRMSYFGDTLAHSALLGVALGLMLEINTTLAVITLCFTLALGLTLLQRQRKLATDTLLGILSHLMLALGLVVIASMENLRIDINSYLFGDMLALTQQDVITTAIVVVVALVAVIRYWNALLLITANEELAQINGIRVHHVRLLLMLLIAATIAVSMHAVGVLLITSLLIIPPASARFISQSPEQMVVFAVLIAMISVALGLAGSFHWDLPAGPSIVLASGGWFFTMALFSRYFSR